MVHNRRRVLEKPDDVQLALVIAQKPRSPETAQPESADWPADSVHLFEQMAPAVPTTYLKDGSVAVSPVWFRYQAGNLEVVLAEDDVKLGRLKRDTRCSLTI